MSKQELLEKIEKKRYELFEVVAKSGLSSPIAIQYSQELDTLLNVYNRLYLKKEKRSLSAQTVN
ncbi:MAG: aspartyl-phosphate phosphatase Spo0E family protein [Bacillus sp. (in: Bacteria)]|nr:aspartyl-phosphate phosphatase Spo0E family protein [Bacillus sp. (in: firmicutes)]